jgi:hypothetical protein
MAYTTINKSTDYFNTKLYTGTGSTQTLTGIGFNADLIWLKNRTDSSTSHVLTDSVRTNAKYLKSDSVDSEGTYTFVSNRGSDGYDVASHSWSGASSKNYVAWNWLKSATAGFDIVSYTGNSSARTISHNCGAIPKMMLIKKRSDSDNWSVYHQGTGAGNYLILNTTSGSGASSTMWNNTTPTASVFSLGNKGEVNANGQTFIAYLFAEIPGYSKFGTYTGNGNADGTFVYTGFKPAWLLIKRSDGGTDNWNLYDNKRLGYNTNYSFLIPNESNAENTTTSTANLDILSNGFKIRGSTGHTNTSGGTYIYMAFAESPFVNSNGVPNNAR